jgi:mono/diheme cytochrome c family protein/uncharacterized membrane protein
LLLLARPTPAHAESEPARPRAESELFREHCAKCHGADGTGSPARGRDLPAPDFTEASWQARRTDAQLRASILDGKGAEMPSFRAKINEEQARGLAAHVRSFAPRKDKPEMEKPKEPPSRRGTDEEIRRLEEELDRLRRQFREVPKAPADGARSRPSDSPPRPAPSDPPAPAATGAPAERELFRQLCEKCHGSDGTGSRARRRQPRIPDFTDTSWQAQRGDAQLLTSILEGKGKEMPPWRGKIEEEQARGLVANVRAFAPMQEKLGVEEQDESTPAEPAQGEPPRGFFEKLIFWLGQSHPAAVHFPIALLTAAALAELLRLVTGKTAFEAISRFCVWFGTLAAVGAGTLGWFAGGFHLTDASRALMTHRWLGTATVACAGLVLVLTEVSRRPDRRRARLGFRAALLVVAVLVLATGYFGGAVVFGLDHYSWPQ